MEVMGQPPSSQAARFREMYVTFTRRREDWAGTMGSADTQ